MLCFTACLKLDLFPLLDFAAVSDSSTIPHFIPGSSQRGPRRNSAERDVRQKNLKFVMKREKKGLFIMSDTKERPNYAPSQRVKALCTQSCILIAFFFKAGLTTKIILIIEYHLYEPIRLLNVKSCLSLQIY